METSSFDFFLTLILIPSVMFLTLTWMIDWVVKYYVFPFVAVLFIIQQLMNYQFLSLILIFAVAGAIGGKIVCDTIKNNNVV